jgi:Cu(I)/Ag(I) efflux system membrane fusion protein
MKTRLLVVCTVLLLVAVSFAAGRWWQARAGRPAANGPAIVEYVCPMHPHYRSDHPGDCGSCGMRLEPVRADGAGGRADAAAAGRGRVRVRAERQQAVGVRLGVAERVAGARTLRTTGRVAPAENAVYPIVAGTSGWVRSVGSATTGTYVRKHERLASFFSPEFAAVQQSWYSGLDTFERTASQQVVAYNNRAVVEGVRRFADTLRNMGVSERQLEEMRTSRELVQDIHLTAPVDGFVLQRNVAAGLRFDRGYEFYRIADLRRVWVLADIYEHQLPFVLRGSSARIRGSQDHRPILATVASTEPIFDEATLTLKVRLEVDNPGLALKPGMFVDVELPIQLPPTLAVHADAIVDSGVRKTVFVDRGEGYFEARLVETGWRLGDQVEITRGLMEGERIVVSGTFLIDSESRMKAAAQGIFGAAAEDPVCGMQVDEERATAAGRTAHHGGRTYFFCADACKKRFEADPARFTGEKPAGSGS